MINDLADRLTAYADLHKLPDEPTPIGVGGLAVVRARAPSPLMNTLYNPLLCLVLQGQKETYLGSQAVTFSAGDTLIVSVNIPTVSQVKIASPDKPYVSLAIEIDLNLLRELQLEAELDTDDLPEDPSIVSGMSSEPLIDSMRRLFDLHACTSTEKKVLAPMLKREIHFRMLFEGHGGMLRSLARPDSHESRINRVILKLQKDYADSISVNEMASVAGMSLSSFHDHFKSVTATSPIQYLKALRLHIARQKLLSSTKSVTRVALEVGYESNAQFSREYTRKFGHPPSHNRN